MTIQENVPLAPYTTLGVGGPARWFVRVRREAELLEAVQFARDCNLPVFILGGGSNLLVADAGFPGLVVQAAFEGPFHIRGPKDEYHPHRHATYCVPAGVDWDVFVRMTCEAGLSGIECLAGIPGLVGGSPVQNIGAYGQEVSQTITEVRVLDCVSLKSRILPSAECGFGYRASIFNSTQRGRYVVTHVTFRFELDATPVLTYPDLIKHFADRSQPTPIEVSDAVREIRRAKGMLLVAGDPDCRSAGSFFKNPIVPPEAFAQLARTVSLDPESIPHWPTPDGKVKLPAAWLLERAGFHKAFRMGRAGISTKHTLALVNLGSATASEILALRDTIVREVNAQFAIALEQEPVLLGFTPQDCI